LTPELRVREATPGDAAEIASVHVRAWRAAYRGLVPDQVLERLSVEEREKRWRDILSAVGRSSITRVAVKDGRVAGFCSLATPSRDDDADERTAEITAIYVDPAVWRMGVGRALLAAGLDELRWRHWRHLTLWVFAENASARAYYSAFAFEPDGARMMHGRSGQVEVRLRTRLMQ